MKTISKITFVCITLFLTCFASASTADEYCSTRIHKIQEIFKSVVYCGYDEKPLFETNGTASALWSKKKVAALEQESLSHLSSRDYIEIMKFQEGALPIKLFLKRSAQLKDGEALCYTRLGILRCTPGAKVVKELTGGPSDLPTVLKQNGYTEVAPYMFRK